MVGILAICTIKINTIIICNNNVAVRQWYREINDWVKISKTGKEKTNEKKDKFMEEENEKNLCMLISNKKDPLWNLEKDAGILITSYSMLSFQGQRSEEMKKVMNKLMEVDWGLMIIDEVQLLPAKTFSMIIKEKFKSHCKLGLTATLVREDEGIQDLYLLLGPKLYEANWLDLQNDGFLARVKCVEIWSEMHPTFYKKFLELENEKNAGEFQKLLYVSNPMKYLITLLLLEKHKGDKIIIFSDNLITVEQYNKFFLQKNLNFRMIHGKIGDKDRIKFLNEFRSESGVNILLMTKVGDISIDIPNANVIIQISSHFASRMQEAQRFGRILRPKKDIFSEYNAFFYTVVSKNTNEMTYSNKRHRFLVDQGYYFSIINDIGNILENKTEREKIEILEKLKNDPNYEAYIEDTYRRVEEKINKKEKIVNDFNDEKDTHEIVNDESLSTDWIQNY